MNTKRLPDPSNKFGVHARFVNWSTKITHPIPPEDLFLCSFFPCVARTLSLPVTLSEANKDIGANYAEKLGIEEPDELYMETWSFLTENGRLETPAIFYTHIHEPFDLTNNFNKAEQRTK